MVQMHREKGKDMVEINFGPTPDVLKEEYLDVIQRNPVRNSKHHKI